MDRPKIIASEVLQDLKDGLTREAIGEKYGLNKSAVKRLFQKKHLKNKKTIKPKEDPFDFVDDIETQAEEGGRNLAEDDLAEELPEQQEVVRESNQIRESNDPFTE
jgi:hypothetical protein